MSEMPPLILLLGLQRSGSTWLTNIFDAHPETSVFMEPFAPAYGIFPEFQGTSYFLDETTPSLEHLLQTELPARLSRYKHLLSARAEVSPDWFKLERMMVNGILRGRRYLPEGLWARARKTQLLNLNRMDLEAPLVSKTLPTAAWVLKELRLAGKVPLLTGAFPDAKFVVLIRHPSANVQAISAWLKRHRLAELRRDLEAFTSTLAAQKVSAKYERELALCRGASFERTIALYWRVHNETMVRHLQGDPRALIVTYEELAAAPLPTSRRILGFCGLKASEVAADYVSRSSTTAISQGGRITTLRDSATHYRAWQGKISPELAADVATITEGSPLMPLFEPYYS